MNESMNLNELQPDRPNQTSSKQDSEYSSVEQSAQASSTPSIAEEIGAVGGGIVGAALGKSIKGNVGAVVGGVAGAIAGGIAAHSAATFTEGLLQETQPSLSLGWGADQKPIELPKHYTWEELQALSKPQIK